MSLIIIKHCTCGEFLKLVPSSKMMQARIAISAPMLRPMGRTKASTLHDWTTPSLLQPHTRMVSVLVLLIGGSPSSLTTTGSRYTSCFWRRNESCFARMLMELSEEWIFLMKIYYRYESIIMIIMCMFAFKKIQSLYLRWIYFLAS